MTRELSKDRLSLLSSGAKDAVRLKGGFEKAAKEIVKILYLLPLVEEGNRLSPKARVALQSKVKLLLKSTFKSADYAIRISAGKFVSRAIKAQTKHLKKLGFPIPTGKDVSRIEKEVIGLLKSEFPPGSGVTYLDRIKAIKNTHIAVAKQLGDRSYRGDIQSILSGKLRSSIAHSGPGGTPVIGGSALKKMQRLSLAESTRLANAAEIKVLGYVGVEFAYWRLNPRHKKSCACDKLSTGTGEGVREALRRSGVDPGSVNLSGLYLVSDWPDYPHPYCGCYPEGWIPTKQKT